MKVILVVCLALAACTGARQPVPYDVYVRNGGLPLPEALRTGKWYNPRPSGDDTFIVGGTDAPAGLVAWTVSLATSSHFCGGSILNERTIITAAHCIDGQSAGNLKVRVGSLRHASGGTQYSVSQIKKHASYSASTIDYDIAILILSSAISIDGTNVKAVSLPSSEPASGSVIRTSGWGTTSQGGSLPATLKYVDVNVVARTTCQSNYGSSSITARMICAGVNGGGKDACQGDSGGPLTQNGVLYGVVSWGRGCAQAGYPGVYTNVYSLLSWINANKA